jgi:hypothetical protein
MNHQLSKPPAKRGREKDGVVYIPIDTATPLGIQLCQLRTLSDECFYTMTRAPAMITKMTPT